MGIFKSDYEKGKEEALKGGGRDPFGNKEYDAGYDYGKGIKDGSKIEKDHKESFASLTIDSITGWEEWQKAGKSESYKKGYERGKETYGKKDWEIAQADAAKASIRKWSGSDRSPASSTGSYGHGYGGTATSFGLTKPAIIFCGLIVLMLIFFISPYWAGSSGIKWKIKDLRSSGLSFGQHQKETHSINVINVYGGKQQRIFAGCLVEEDKPMWSPDGKKISFLRLTKKLTGGYRRDLYAVDANGDNRVCIVKDIASTSNSSPAYSWSRCGLILFCKPPNRFFLFDGNGKKLKVFLPGKGSPRKWQIYPFFVSNTVWSPDGKRILFYGIAKNRQSLSPKTQTLSSVYVMWFTPYGFVDFATAGRAGPDYSFVYSPDSRKILIGGKKYFEVSILRNTGGWRFNTEKGESLIGHSCCWSPDGKHIAFITRKEREEPIINIVGADGSNRLKLIRAEKYSWSPGGQQLVCQHKGHLYVIDIVDHQHTWRMAEGTCPIWSPDGRRIVFQQATGIGLIDFEKENIRKLVNKGSNFSWSPDGRKILFTKRVNSAESS